ncbi:helix-turn-helix domain-containing protein [Ferviditalea candida]|uniref:Helix-turn-helix transcriptional regulator n=1 Tax=Ferviditalea candida TaxID=3108399 RepID=A0ABU5ZE75_9BACL|nr:helix-turn-helix transcriptional regulator [Paenibacillaceae bacterium T2]
MRIVANRDIFTKSRILKGLSQRELARQSGLSHGYISLIERGNKSIGPKAAKKVSEILDKNVEELFIIE